MATSRSRLACLDCTRRKVKCDKEIPCSNCIKRNNQDACTREVESSTPASTQASLLGARDAGSTLETLSTRIAELEARLGSDRAAHHSIPAPGSRYVPPVPAASSKSAERTTQVTKGSEIEDAASILEFLAWGRMKNPDLNDAVPPEKPIGRPPASTPTGESIGNDMSDLQILQLNMPPQYQVHQLVYWHLECLLWYHGSFHAPTFQTQLQEFYDVHNGSILSEGVNLQWVALLFSILTGSMTCASRELAQRWGYRETEQDTLSHRWYRGTIDCLNRGDYMTHYSLDAVEAIATLTISAHMIGYSNQQSILLASAIKISQSLGLHRLGAEPDNPTLKDIRGRRAWAQLCTQDWFSIPFSESYLIHLLYTSTARPGNRCDKESAVLPDSQPTILSYARYLLDVAYIMPQLQDAVMASNTLYTKYEQVLKYDKQMRALATVHRPSFLSNVPIDPTWPHYIPWARRALAISYSHKICMIHRAFLGLSFTNSAFSFSRRTCIAAAKTIIKEHTQAEREDGPVLWIYHAFSVAACIILCLDIFHRSPEEPETSEHRLLIEESIKLLGANEYKQSAIATRGVKLLSDLLEAIDRSRSNPRKRRADESANPESSGTLEKRQRFLDMPRFVKSFIGGSQSPASNNHEAQSTRPGNDSSVDPLLQDGSSQLEFTEEFMNEIDKDVSREDLYGTFPLSQAPFDGASTFEQLLFLAGGYET